MSDGKNRITNGVEFDFMPIGQAIKKAREANDTTREQLAEQLDYAARHIQAIENEGQYPSFQLFTQLVTMFDISIDNMSCSSRMLFCGVLGATLTREFG